MKKILFLITQYISLTSFSQWVEQSSGFTSLNRGINSLNIVNDSVVWAGAYDGANTSNYITEFTKTSSGGQSWTSGIINTGLIGAGLANISAINKDTAWACIFHPTQALAGGIWKTTDGGISWAKQNSAAFISSSFPNFVYFWDRNQGITVGDPIGNYFEIYTTNDGGNTWTRTPNINNQLSSNAGSEYGYTNVFSVSGNTLWFGTSTGRVFKTEDFGITFTNSTPSNNVTDIQRIIFTDSLVGYACTHTAGNKSWKIAKTIDGGGTWSALQNNTAINNTNILGADICAVPGTNALISVGSDASAIGSSYSFDGGLNWSLMEDTSLAPQRLSVRFLNSNTGWCGGFNINQNNSGVFKFEGTVGISLDKNIKNNISIFPNPTQNKLYTCFKDFEGPIVEFELRSFAGNTILKKEIEVSNENKFFETDLSEYPKGIYLLTIKNNSAFLSTKILVQ